MEWKSGTLRSILKMNKDKLIFLFCSGLLLFILSMPNDGGNVPGYEEDSKLEIEMRADSTAVRAADGITSYEKVTSVEQELELRVREILSGVEGVGELEVMVFLKPEENEHFFQENNTDRQSPEVSGIIISADGGGSTVIKTEISEAMEALFGLPSHKIKVLKRVKKESEE